MYLNRVKERTVYFKVSFSFYIGNSPIILAIFELHEAQNEIIKLFDLRFFTFNCFG